MLAVVLVAVGLLYVLIGLDIAWTYRRAVNGG